MRECTAVQRFLPPWNEGDKLRIWKIICWVRNSDKNIGEQ